jgi:hypothetical protein
MSDVPRPSPPLASMCTSHSLSLRPPAIARKAQPQYSRTRRQPQPSDASRSSTSALNVTFVTLLASEALAYTWKVIGGKQVFFLEDVDVAERALSRVSL